MGGVLEKSNSLSAVGKNPFTTEANIMLASDSLLTSLVGDSLIAQAAPAPAQAAPPSLESQTFSFAPVSLGSLFLSCCGNK